jgi:hypothetical protein
VFADPDRLTDRRDRAALLVWLGLARTGELAAGADVAATSEAWYDELRLPGALAAGCTMGFDEVRFWWRTSSGSCLPFHVRRPFGVRRGAKIAGSWRRG